MGKNAWTLTLLATAVSACLASNGVAQLPARLDRLTEFDRSFLLKAVDDGRFEVRMGKLAQERGTSAAVREFGRTMAVDHTTANQELTDLVERKGISVPKDMSEKNRVKVDRLAKLEGKAFDDQYVKFMVAGHVTDVTVFEDEAAKGGDVDVRALADKLLPTLRLHLSRARELAERLK